MRDETPPNSESSRIRELPTWLISQVSAHSHLLLSDAFAAAEARGYHYRLLVALDEFGPSSQATLARRSGIDRSDVVAALNELAREGFVKRAPDPTDRRRNTITMTRAGQNRLRHLEDVVTDAQRTLLAPLRPADRKELVRLLARLADSIPGQAETG